MGKDTTTKPKSVDFFQIPDKLWQVVERDLPPT